MTKNERILKQQIKELERLVEIKDAVIVELKSLIKPTWTYSTSGDITVPYITTDVTNVNPNTPVTFTTTDATT